MVESTHQRVIVMTGATAGLGADAAKILAEQPGTRLIVGARGTARSVPGAEVLGLDLASLDSVRQFAGEVRELLGDNRIDSLVLNAGLQFRDTDHRTADGFETTFAVNHLAHYLLARLLLPAIADNGLLLITTSDTHDPAIIPVGPRSLDPQGLAYPRKGGALAGFRAYAASKLCNLLTAQAFVVADEVMRRGISVVAYNPGLTIGTGLGGLDSAGARALRPVLRVVSVFLPQAHPGSVQRSGEALAALSVGAVKPPLGRIYASLVKGEITFPDPAPLARSSDARDRLWADSSAMVGLEAS